jgi:hypothetical protein
MVSHGRNRFPRTSRPAREDRPVIRERPGRSGTTAGADAVSAWIMALLTVVAIVLPLTLTAETGAKAATALINLAIGSPSPF